jgi:hypothetical protein
MLHTLLSVSICVVHRLKRPGHVIRTDGEKTVKKVLEGKLQEREK